MGVNARKSQHGTKNVKGYNWAKRTKLTQLKPKGVLRYYERVRNACFISVKNSRISHEKRKDRNVTRSKEIYLWASRTQTFRYG
jgi:hypothetical protein